MASKKKKAEPRSLSAELRRMSDTLDYFGLPHEEGRAPVPEVEPAPVEPPPLAPPEPVPDPAPAIEPAPKPVARVPKARVAVPAPSQPVWEEPTVQARVSAPAFASPPPSAAQQTLATYRRSQYQPMVSAALRSVPAMGAAWPSRLTDALIHTLSPYEFLVYHYLFVQSYGHGLLSYRCPRRDIAIATGLSEPTVRRALQCLEAELSLLSVTELPRFVYEFAVLVPEDVLAAWTTFGSEEGTW
jgi:hypothetical protein